VDSDLEPSEQRVAPTGGSGCSWPAAIAVVAIAGLVAMLVFYFMQTTLHLPETMGRGLADAAAKLGGLFGTEVKVDNQSVTLESREIMELATVQHRIVCVSKYETKWAGSTATIIIRGVYTAKAGFSLDKGTTFRLDEKGRVLDETIPPSKILSVTTDEQKVFYDAQGVLKTLDARDYEEAFRQNRAQATHEAERMGMREEARERLKERLQDMLPRPIEKSSIATPRTAAP
jgi:hypothetical protein